ncbi:MAG: ribonuclease H-like domain-containing protein [Rickettsiales bacterium]|jgi:DNA polymerase-3 subunit epsilon|nr:ribonuclease H-like domain-containing protein [Rickettsiales bacterium]
MAREVCFDCETTGFDWMHGDRIIEIGAVEIIDDRITDKSLHLYINPDGKIIPKSAFEVHKISNHFLEDKPKFGEVAKQLTDFFGDSLVVAHNGQDFDFPFLNYELKQAGLPEIPKNQLADSIIIARGRVFGPKSYSLDALAKWFGISLETRTEGHGAIIDARILANIYLELTKMNDAETYDEMKDRFRKAVQNLPRNGEGRAKREFLPSADDTAAFQASLEKSVTNAMWNQE